MKYHVVHERINLIKFWINDSSMPGKSTVIDSFPSLEKALNWMEQIDMRMMYHKMAINEELPSFIQHIGIIDKNESIVASKFYMPADRIKNFPEGIYMQINPDVITVADFERLSGFKISDLKDIDGHGKTYLVVSIQDLLKQRIDELRKHISSRIVKPRDDRGITLN